MSQDKGKSSHPKDRQGVKKKHKHSMQTRHSKTKTKDENNLKLWMKFLESAQIQDADAEKHKWVLFGRYWDFAQTLCDNGQRRELWQMMVAKTHLAGKQAACEYSFLLQFALRQVQHVKSQLIGKLMCKIKKHKNKKTLKTTDEEMCIEVPIITSYDAYPQRRTTTFGASGTAKGKNFNQNKQTTSDENKTNEKTKQTI